MRRMVLVALLATMLVPGVAQAQLEEVRQKIFGMD